MNTAREATTAALTAALSMIIRTRPVLALRMHRAASRFASPNAPRPLFAEDADENECEVAR